MSAKGVRLADGTRLRSELTLWTAGLAPPALLRESGLARPPQVWADVHPTLQSRHSDNIFVVGDAAQLPQAVGKQAYNAIDMGALAAANVTRFLDGRALKPFKPAPKPVLIAFGRLQHRAPHAPHVEGADDQHALQQRQRQPHAAEGAVVHHRADDQRHHRLADVQPANRPRHRRGRWRCPAPRP